MNEEARHKLIWGWLRLFLGFAQMSLVAMSLGALLAVGLRTITLVFFAGATLSMALSRLLYHGRKDPKLAQRKHR